MDDLTKTEIELYEILNDYAEDCVKLAQDFQEGKRISFTAGWDLTQKTHEKIMELVGLTQTEKETEQ